MTDINKLHGEENNEQAISKTGDVVSAYSDTVAHALKDCKYPNHKGYAELWTKYGNDEKYKDFFLNLRIEENDIILDNKKFSLLKVNDNGLGSISGNAFDSSNKTGSKDLSYFEGTNISANANTASKKVFQTQEEVSEFITTFPGNDWKEKCKSIVTLLGLPMSGLWNSYDPQGEGNGKWEDVNNKGYLMLSNVITKNRMAQGDSPAKYVLGIEWDSNNIEFKHENPETYYRPLLAFEDC